MYVELKNINKTYGSYQASRNVNFGIEKGKLIGLLGPSGSGKTTILRMIAGLETPDSGEVIIDGKVVNDVPASQRGIGFVFQNYALFAVLGGQEHCHKAAFQLGVFLHAGNFRAARGEVHQQLLAQVGVRHLAAAEADADLDAVAVVQEFLSGLDLGVEVIGVDAGDRPLEELFREHRECQPLVYGRQYFEARQACR